MALSNFLYYKNDFQEEYKMKYKVKPHPGKYKHTHSMILYWSVHLYLSFSTRIQVPSKCIKLEVQSILLKLDCPNYSPVI